MTGGGRQSQNFFPFSVKSSLSVKKTRKNYSAVIPVIFQCYMLPKMFITMGQKKKIGTTVNDDKSAEKPLS